MRLGKYEVLGPIGVGGFGKVWLAQVADEERENQCLVAIKRMRRNGPTAHRGGGDPSRYLEAFKAEAEIGSYLKHPNIVQVLALDQVKDDHLLVMEFVNGLGLDELLSQRRDLDLALPPDIALDIAIQTGEGLYFAHTAASALGEPLHIIHRDVKPSNIMISRSGVAKIMDFGVARSNLPRTRTTVGTIKGTLRYLSPEQAQGDREVGPASDQFALGLVLVEMLIGRPVYDAVKDHLILRQAMRGQVHSAIEWAGKTCEGISPAVMKALAYEPEDRFGSMVDFVEALRPLRDSLISPCTLRQWIHLGLEERARRALEHPDEYLIADTSLASASHFFSGGGSVNPSGRNPPGWAQELMGNFEDSASEGERSQDWAASTSTPEVAPILAALPASGEGWAMMEKSEGFPAPPLLLRGPPTGEWPAPGLSSAAGLGASFDSASLGIAGKPGAIAPSDCTSYAVRRPRGSQEDVRQPARRNTLARRAASVQRVAGDGDALMPVAVDEPKAPSRGSRLRQAAVPDTSAIPVELLADMPLWSEPNVAAFVIEDPEDTDASSDGAVTLDPREHLPTDGSRPGGLRSFLQRLVTSRPRES